MSADRAATFSTRSGVVASFDERAGAVTVVESEGTTWPFHCTSFADGSRTIDPGAAVRFRVATGPNGLEAFDLVESPGAIS